MRYQEPGAARRPQYPAVFWIPRDLPLSLCLVGPILNHKKEVNGVSAPDDHTLVLLIFFRLQELLVLGFKHAAREAVVPLEPFDLVWIVRGVVHPVLVQHMDTFDSALKSHRLLARP